MELKDRLKELRNDKNISAAKLADALNRGKSTLGMWETGKANPDISTLITIADYFDCSVDYLLGRTNTKAEAVEIQKFIELTGLSEKAVNVLCRLNLPRHHNRRYHKVVQALSYLLEQEEPAPDLYDFTVAPNNEFELPAGDDEEIALFLAEYSKWEANNYIPVLSALSRYLLIQPTDDKQFTVRESGTILTDDEKLTESMENLLVGKFHSWSDINISTLSGSDIIENVFMSKLQEQAKKLKQKIHDKNGKLIGNNF